jgi:glutathione S-transferase
MRLYSGPVSLFSAKVRIALAEKRAPYQRIEVGWSLARRYEPHHPDVVALHPKRQVPVLVDGDLVVYDSTQIFEYLEERLPEPPLYPRDLAGRARCRRLEAAADEQVFPAVWELIDAGLYASAHGGRDEVRLVRGREALARQHVVLDSELAGRRWLCGDQFTVADIATFVFVNAGAALGAPPGEPHQHVAAWFARTLARPTVEREVREMQAFLARALQPAPSPSLQPMA